MLTLKGTARIAFSLLWIVFMTSSVFSQDDWTHYVRIGGYGLKSDNAEEIVRKAKESNVFGIEVDNDIPGRYESFVNPEEKLQADSRGG